MKPSSIDGLPCPRVRELSDTFLDDELIASLQSLIFRHLRACGECAMFIMRKIRVKDLVRKSVNDLVVPASLRQKVWAQTRN